MEIPVRELIQRLRRHQHVVVKEATQMVYVHINNVGIKALGMIDGLRQKGYVRVLCNDKRWNQIK